MLPWAVTFFFLAIVSFCIGIFQDHRGGSAFAFYIVGLCLLGLAVVLLLFIVMTDDFPARESRRHESPHALPIPKSFPTTTR